MARTIVVDLSKGDPNEDLSFYFSERVLFKIPDLPAGAYSELRIAPTIDDPATLVVRGRSQIDLRESDYLGKLTAGIDYVYMILVILDAADVIRDGKLTAAKIIDGDLSIPPNAFTYMGEPYEYDGDALVFVAA